MKKIVLNLTLASLFLSPVCASNSDLADQTQTKQAFTTITPSELCEKIEYDSLASTRGGLWGLRVTLVVSASFKYDALMGRADNIIKNPNTPYILYKTEKETFCTPYPQAVLVESYKRSLGHALQMVDPNRYSLGNLEGEYGPLGHMSHAIDRMNAVDKVNTSVDLKMAEILKGDWDRVKLEAANIARILNECQVIANEFKRIESERIELYRSQNSYNYPFKPAFTKQQLDAMQVAVYNKLSANKKRFELAAFTVKDWLDRSKSDL